ncbi:MAG: MATE family efflux transporter [Solobacterium sp.]|nr:MATE family efflux transporter [Solobacterium sp.]
MTEHSKVNRITEGNIPRQLLAYFFPLLIGSVFQTLYNTVDSIIVGRFVGATALAAVGGSGIAIGLLIGFFMGVGAGGTVIISQYYGAQNEEKLSKAVHTLITMALILGTVMSVLGQFAARPLLRLIKMDPEILDLSVLYLRIIFGSLLFFTIYNLGGAILRAIGDSKRPRNYLILTCILNIFLDLLFVLVLQMSVAGVAIATAASVAVSSFLVANALMRTDDIYRVSIHHLGIDLPVLKEIIRIGLPAGGTSMAYTLSNMIIQSAVNSFGAAFTAAWVAFGKIDNVIFMIQGAFGMSVTTFVGQNYGAAKYGRVKESIRTGILMSVSITLVLSILMYVFSPTMIAWFAEEPHVIEIGTSVLRVCAPFYFMYAFIEILSGAIRGSGEALAPMAITLVTICAMRFVWIYLVAPRLGGTIEAITACYPATWIFAAVVFILYYSSYRKRFRTDG